MLIDRTAPIRTRLPSLRVLARQSVSLLAAVLLASCSSSGGRSYDPSTQFNGVIAADEPNAVNAARQVLTRGGSAADAAVTLGLALAVTLPSRASLGGGGICLMHLPNRPTVEALEFMPRRADAATSGGAVSGAPNPAVSGQQNSADAGSLSSAAVPGLVRGLAGIQARFGKLRWAETVAPAENLARFRARVSRSLSQDIAAYAASAGFDGQDLVEGEEFTQVPLADSLGQIRAKGPGEFYTGALGAAISAATGIPMEALRQYTPDLQVPLRAEIGNDVAFFPPTPGGQASRAVWSRLGEVRRLSDLDVTQRAQALLDIERSFVPPEMATRVAAGQGPTGASTGFVVVDQNGGAVACALTMGTPFGTGRIIGDTGILAARPDASGGELELSLAPVLAINPATMQFGAAYVGSGSAAAAGDVSLLGRVTEQGDRPLADSVGAPRAFGVPGGPGIMEAPLTLPGLTQRRADDRLNGAVCTGGLPRNPGSCDGRSDSRGAGAGGIIDSPL